MRFPKVGDVASFEELAAIGGKFYGSGDGGSFCDTALHSWKLDPARGFVCIEGPEPAEGPGTSAGPRLISIEEQRELIPDEAIRRAFLDREDIRGLDPADQAARWEAHRAKVDEMRRQLAKIPGFVVGPD